MFNKHLVKVLVSFLVVVAIGLILLVVINEFK
jgi:hypothetical protein